MVISAPKSIAIFGGTFDPIHRGHLNSVKLLEAKLNFDAIHWVLSARPPHKDQTSASIVERFEMMQLALADFANQVADDTEIKRHAESYTVDTVETFKARFSQAKLTVIIGGDSLLSLPKWHRYPELVEMVNWVVMNRPGYELDLVDELQQRLVAEAADLSTYKGGKIWVFEDSQFDVSSTALRAELQAFAEDPKISPKLSKEFLPEAVFTYIQQRHLYKIAAIESGPTISRTTISQTNMKPEQIKDQVVDALEDVKGVDIRVIDIADISDFADYMLVVSGTSDTHVKALARSASDKLRSQGVIPLNEDGADVGEWVLVDFGDVVLHVMRPEVREYYDLEKLWDEDVRALMKKHREEQESS